MTKVVHVIGGDPQTVKMFADAGWNCYDQEADLVCFTGGADVSPELYCEPPTHSSTNPHRDIYEVGQYLKYLRLGVPMVGICRGGQFLNVMNGGRMIQHLDNPHYMCKRRVEIFDIKGNRKVHTDTSSSEVTPWLHEDHHQGMVPAPHGKILGIDKSDKNVEIILYPFTWSTLEKNQMTANHLCFQAHPEWGHDGTRKLFFSMIEEYLVQWQC